MAAPGAGVGRPGPFSENASLATLPALDSLAGTPTCRHRSGGLLKIGIFGIIVAVIGAYIASVGLYANGGGAHRHDAEAPAASDRTTVRMNVEEVQSNYSVLVANLTVFPGPELLDPQTGHLNEDLGLRVRSTCHMPSPPTQSAMIAFWRPGVITNPSTDA